MAVISRETVHIDGSPFIKRLSCTAEGEFSMNVPKLWVTLLNAPSTITGTTRKSIDDQWREMKRTVRSVSTETRKVIAYWLQDREEIYFAQGAGLLLFASVYMEHKRTVSKDPDIFHYDYDRVCIKDDLPSYIRQHTGSLKSPDGREEFAILEWTPERHRFFTDISDALEALVGKLQSLKDVKVVDKLIASRVPLLPPAQGAE